MSGTDQLAHDLASRLGSKLEPLGFKSVKIKSLRFLCRQTSYGQDQLWIDVTRYHNGSYAIAFHFRVRHDAVVDLTASEFGEHTDQLTITVAQNSYGVHPNRPINYAGPTFWNVSLPVDWTALLPEVIAFLDAAILPWFEKFAGRANVRRSLVTDDGWTMGGQFQWQTVAALDILAGKEEDLARYFTELRKKSHNWHPPVAQRLDAFVKSISVRLPPDFVAWWSGAAAIP